jgi:hypothetical protein
MYKRALQGNKEALGAEHTSTLRTVNNLGNLYKSQSKLAEARIMYLKALEGYQKVIGYDHPKCRRLQEKLNALDTKMEDNVLINMESSGRTP